MFSDPSLSNGNCVNPIGNISGTIVRPPPPQQTAPPTSGKIHYLKFEATSKCYDVSSLFSALL